MFLVRTAFCLGLVVMVLPSDEKHQAELYDKAASATRWTLTFCDRNAVACSKGAELWQTFQQKAQFGARLTADLVEKGMKGRLEPIVVPSADGAPERGPRQDDATPRRTASAR